MGGFLPSNDNALLAWATNFGTRIETSPALFGLSAAQIAAFDQTFVDFRDALLLCEPGVKSKSGVTAKNAARALLVTQAKLAANTVNGQALVTDAQKQLLGLNIRKKPTPTPVPTTAPVIQLGSVEGWTVKLRLRAAEGSRRARPVGALGASVFSFVGPVPPSDVVGWKFEGVVGKTTFDVVFDNSLASGTKVWVTAFWFNGRKESGPATAPVSTFLQGGAMAAINPLKMAA